MKDMFYLEDEPSEDYFVPLYYPKNEFISQASQLFNKIPLEWNLLLAK